MAIHRIFEDIFLVDLDLSLPGFQNFLSSWIIRDGHRAIVIDPGPSATINTLVNALHEIQIKKIDYIFLTHIHLDHAGGCGALAQIYPETPIICHTKGIEHLSNPDRLWEGSIDVLGDLAIAYGKPLPIPESSIYTETNIRWNDYDIRIVNTPGHASHHMSFLFNGIVFAGEVAGIQVPRSDGLYIRPATPPPFLPQVALQSISDVINLAPHIICYAHYGFLGNACKFLNMAKEQVKLWLEIIEERKDKGLHLEYGKIFEEILARDSHVGYFNQFDPGVRKRELYFINNSIKGMVNFINKR